MFSKIDVNDKQCSLKLISKELALLNQLSTVAILNSNCNCLFLPIYVETINLILIPHFIFSFRKLCLSSHKKRAKLL